MENEYKLAKIKVPVNLCQNTDPTMKLVRQFEENSAQSGHHSLLKDAINYAKELHLDLKLGEGELSPPCRTVDGKETEGRRIGTCAKESQQEQLHQETEEEKWQGKSFKSRWSDIPVMLSKSCFDWMKEWKTCPSSTIAGIHELYQQLLPTKLYLHNKMGTNPSSDVLRRMCGSGPESIPHILARCSTLAKTKYIARHNASLKVLFFELLKYLNYFNTKKFTMVLGSAGEAHVRE